MKEDIVLYHEQDLIIIDKNEMKSFSYAQILYVHYDSPYIKIVTTDQHYTLIKTSLSNMIRYLPESFILCNKSFIVNLLHVKSIIKEKDNFALHLYTEDVIPISRRKINNIKEKYLDIRLQLKEFGFCVSCHGLKDCRLKVLDELPLDI